MGTSGNEIPAALFHRRVPAADRRLHVRECAVRTFLSPDPDVQLAERAEAGRLRIKETTVNLDSPRSQSKKRELAAGRDAGRVVATRSWGCIVATQPARCCAASHAGE